MILGRVGLLRPATPDLGPTTMTDDKIALRQMLEKGSDATFLREMIGFAAQRLMCAVRRHHFSFRNALSTANSRTWTRSLVAS